MQLEIRNGRLINPATNQDEITNLYIKAGKLVSIGTNPPTSFQADEVIDATDKWVFPGLVDLQARLGLGKEQSGDIVTETQAAVAGGVTSLCCPPDTNPITDTQAVAELIRRRARQAATAFVMPLGALTKGLEGELLSDMHSLSQGGCVAMSQADTPIENPLNLKNALEYAASHDLLVMLRSENQQLKNNGVAHLGAVSTRLGLPAIPASAETIALARDLILVEETGVRAHFSKLSTAGAVELIAAAKKKGLPVTCDVAIHQLHLSEMELLDFNSLFHTTPPLRSLNDKDALRMGVKMGIIDAIVSDHTPLQNDAKQLPFSESEPGISSLETLLNLTLRLVDEGLISLQKALELTSLNPANILQMPGGKLEENAPVDLVIFDPEAIWTVSEETLVSSSKNTPFLGWEFYGQVEQTFFQGKEVFTR